MHKTLNVNFFIHDPITREAYSRDPRNVAKKAEAYLASSGIADTAYFGPEAEFYIFDSIRHSTGINEGYYHIDSVEGSWNSGSLTGENGGPNLGYKTRAKGGYFPVEPYDHYSDLRSTMMTNLTNAGPRARARPPRGRHRRSGRDQLQVRHAAAVGRQPDAVQVHHQEHRLGRTARRRRSCPSRCSATTAPACTATRASGRTASRSSTPRPATRACPTSPATTSAACSSHAPSLLAFTNPTVNSYHRLVPGYEAPINLVYSARNRSACCRIPISGDSPKAKRIEFRVPDPSANPYLAFSAMLMAGLDGIKNKIEPPAPVDKDLYELPPEEALGIEKVPASLDAVLDRLEVDHDYLLEGGVFTPDLIETWIEYKRENEIDPIRLRPHPHEFAMYYDI